MRQRVTLLIVITFTSCLLVPLSFAQAATPPAPLTPTQPTKAAPVPSKIISQIVAAARGHAFTSREIRIGAVINYVLTPGASKDILAQPGSPEFDQQALHGVLDWLADQESLSFKATELSNSEIQEATKKIMAGSSKPEVAPIWNSLEVTAGELKSLIQRKLNAQKFVGFKSRASYLPISDDDAEAYYKANQGRFGDEPFSKFKDDIKAILVKKQADQRLDEWFGILQKKYKVRYFPTVRAEG